MSWKELLKRKNNDVINDYDTRDSMRIYTKENFINAIKMNRGLYCQPRSFFQILGYSATKISA
jgi:hypothetical protein